MDNSFWIFTILGAISGGFYSFKGLELGWNPDYGFKHILNEIKQFKTQQKDQKPEAVPKIIDRRDIFKTDPPPCSWQIERFIQAFVGCLFGWWILWFLLDKRLNAFNGFKDMHFEWWDGATFIIGYIGINGRLPTIAHAVQEWFRR